MGFDGTYVDTIANKKHVDVASCVAGITMYLIVCNFNIQLSHRFIYPLMPPVLSITQHSHTKSSAIIFLSEDTQCAVFVPADCTSMHSKQKTS